MWWMWTRDSWIRPLRVTACMSNCVMWGGAYGRGLAVHCGNRHLYPNKYAAGGWADLDFQTELLDCHPASLDPKIYGPANDIGDSRVMEGECCDTNLGYKVCYEREKSVIDIARIIPRPPCNDADRDGYQSKDDPKGCTLQTANDCNDNPALGPNGQPIGASYHPDVQEICDGEDNDCDGMVDKSGDVNHPQLACRSCFDWDDYRGKAYNFEVVRYGEIQGREREILPFDKNDPNKINPEVYGYEPTIAAQVQVWGDIFMDTCGDADGQQKDFHVTEYYCRDKGLESVMDVAYVMCNNEHTCLGGACVPREECKDGDGDGLQGYTGTCRLTTKKDCDDSDAAIRECCNDLDRDGLQNPNDPPGCKMYPTWCYDGPCRLGKDCDDNNNLLGECCNDKDTDGYQNAYDPAPLKRQAGTLTCKMTLNPTKPDCNDLNAAIHPGAQEVCKNGQDDDCDGSTDENCGGGNTASCKDSGNKVTYSWIDSHGVSQSYTFTDYCSLGQMYDYSCNGNSMTGTSYSCNCQDLDGKNVAGYFVDSDGNCLLTWVVGQFSFCAQYDSGPNSNQAAVCY